METDFFHWPLRLGMEGPSGGILFQQACAQSKEAESKWQSMAGSNHKKPTGWLSGTISGKSGSQLSTVQMLLRNARKWRDGEICGNEEHSTMTYGITTDEQVRAVSTTRLAS